MLLYGNRIIFMWSIEIEKRIKLLFKYVYISVKILKKNLNKII